MEVNERGSSLVNGLMGVGAVLAAGGLILAVITFNKAIDVFNAPETLKPWMELAANVEFPGEEKRGGQQVQYDGKNSEFLVFQKTGPAGRTVFEIEGKFIRLVFIFLAIYLLGIMARISLGILGKGIGLLMNFKVKPQQRNTGTGSP